MASAWGKFWAKAWGNAWGKVSDEVEIEGGSSGGQGYQSTKHKVTVTPEPEAPKLVPNWRVFGYKPNRKEPKPEPVVEPIQEVVPLYPATMKIPVIDPVEPIAEPVVISPQVIDLIREIANDQSIIVNYELPDDDEEELALMMILAELA